MLSQQLELNIPPKIFMPPPQLCLQHLLDCGVRANGRGGPFSMPNNIKVNRVPSPAGGKVEMVVIGLIVLSYSIPRMM